MENSTAKKIKIFIVLVIMLLFFWQANDRSGMRDYDAALVYQLGGFVFAIAALILFFRK